MKRLIIEYLILLATERSLLSKYSQVSLQPSVQPNIHRTFEGCIFLTVLNRSQSHSYTHVTLRNSVSQHRRCVPSIIWFAATRLAQIDHRILHTCIRDRVTGFLLRSLSSPSYFKTVLEHHHADCRNSSPNVFSIRIRSIRANVKIGHWLTQGEQALRTDSTSSVTSMADRSQGLRKIETNILLGNLIREDRVLMGK